MPKRPERFAKPTTSHVVESAKIRGRYFAKGDDISVSFNRWGEPEQKVRLDYGRIEEMTFNTYPDKSIRVEVMASDLGGATFGGADAEMFQDIDISRISRTGTAKVNPKKKKKH